MEIKVYETGAQFLNEYGPFLADRFPSSCFMLGNSLHMDSLADGFSVAISDSDQNVLLGQCRYPYNLTIVGDASLSWELYDFLRNENAEVPGIIGEKSLVQAFLEHVKFFKLREQLQYMQWSEGDLGNMRDVYWAGPQDVEQIADLEYQFRVEINAFPPLTHDDIREAVAQSVGNYAVCKLGDKVVAQAKLKMETDKHICLSGAITLPAYRNRGYMRRIIQFLCARVWCKHKTPYLFVDENNPISGPLYHDIGFAYGPHFLSAEMIL